ncbi:MAG TPA: glutamate cyclase domain-containing protein [Thermomicrobiaceae bacterium]|nr:glutamate cyclase domain-containing protein [Thermomicrobiaceae bacterium]
MSGGDVARVLEVIAQDCDQLMTLELRPRGYSHGVIHHLYHAAREKVGEPLAMAAARRLTQSAKAGDVVILTTGAGNARYLPKGETDGPLGLTAIARILADGFGIVPVIVTEADYVSNIEATAVAAGLGIRGVDEAGKVAYTTAVLPFPNEAEAARRGAADLLDRLDPKAIVAVEKLGPNAVGVAHSATGLPMGEERAQVEHLFAAARERGILTVGIGDNGNEIGFGLIQEAVWEFKPFGRTCRCPCGQGMATVVATDVLVVAGTSNWGGYAVEACLAAIAGKPELIHGARVEQRMLEECVRTGAVDGSTGRQILQVDGTVPEVQLAFNELFRAIVRSGLEEPRSRPF